MTKTTMGLSWVFPCATLPPRNASLRGVSTYHAAKVGQNLNTSTRRVKPYAKGFATFALPVLLIDGCYVQNVRSWQCTDVSLIKSLRRFDLSVRKG